MIRKMLAVLTLGMVGLFTLGGTAAAAPPAPNYPAPPTVTDIFVTININITIINNGTLIIFSGGGFDPLEGILINAFNQGAPTGLRSSPALARMAAADTSTTADSSGAFAIDLTDVVDEVGVWKLTATGASSGKTASSYVTVLPVGSTLPALDAGTTTFGTGSSSASTALATTGASVAGPIAVGAAALFAGLAMLFFGTRGVIRRKSARSAG